jgi:hypothetical protein
MEDVVQVSSLATPRLTKSAGRYLRIRSVTQQAKQAILQQLEQTSTPLRVRELIQQTGLEACDLKRALWSLVDEGRIKFTQDRRICKHVLK